MSPRCSITRSARPNTAARSSPRRWRRSCAARASTSIDIGNRFEITFLEVGADLDHVHFLAQSVPTYSPKKIVQTIKSITAREVFARVPSVKQALWGGAFWPSGHYIDTVGRHGSEETIRSYVAVQGREREYRRLHFQPLEPPDPQLELF